MLDIPENLICHADVMCISVFVGTQVESESFMKIKLWPNLPAVSYVKCVLDVPMERYHQ